jgi:hypothetical protein
MERHKIIELDQKSRSINLLFARNTSHKQRHVHTLKVEGWRKIYQVSRCQNQVGIGILILDKADFKQKLVRRDKLIKEVIHQEDEMILTLYAPNFSAPKFIK